MANWISSKLKVAETFLQQIDQQAAESLKKNEIPPSPDDLQNKTRTKPESSSSILPLKDQFKKRTDDPPIRNEDSIGSKEVVTSTSISTSPLPSKSPSPAPIPSTNPKPLTDTDWTELLSTPKQLSSPPVARRTNGVSAVRKKPMEVKKNQKSRTQTKLDSKINGVPTTNNKFSDGDESSSGNSVPSVPVKPFTDNVDDGKIENFGKEVVDVKSRVSMPMPSIDMAKVGQVADVSGKVNGIGEVKKQLGEDFDGIGRDETKVVSRRSSVAQDLSAGASLSSDGTSSSESGSTSSSSDSEKENERKAERARRREQLMAEKAAAKAVEVIKERENVVARLEGEKQSLEKILEERAKQQAQEASELQTSMMETMDAVDLEKQKHNNTRMEALARLTELESANADLARSLATTQRSLEIEVSQVAELRQQIESKEAVQGELRRRISKIQLNGSSSNQLEASKGIEFEREILEAEYSFTTDKIGQLQEKEKNLEENIEMARKEIEDPTEVEVELKRRLAQMTDHLIQKQTQVEGLSSEKATLLFRIETVSRMIEEQQSMLQLSDVEGSSLRSDLEAGIWRVSDSKLKHSFADRVRSGSEHFGSLIRQLDAIFCAGAAFLRRNSQAKFLSIFYLVCLHFWVVYILTSHSQVSDIRSGAVVSLESINKTTGTS